MNNEIPLPGETRHLGERYSPEFYEIKVKGELDPIWAKWFEGMTLATVKNGESGWVCTLISGPVADQPALHGLLTKIRDLNLTLISVRRMMNRAGKRSEEALVLDDTGEKTTYQEHTTAATSASLEKGTGVSQGIGPEKDHPTVSPLETGG